jgi:DNA-binding NtrC family response regulator
MRRDDDTRTLQLDAEAPSPTSVPGLLHVYAEGRDAPVSAWSTRKGVTFGRAADVTLDDESLSRRHFEVRAEAKGFHVRDLGSRNGTRVAGRTLRGDEALVPAGTVVRAGLQVFVTAGDVQPFVARSRHVVAPELGGPGMDAVRRAVVEAASSALPALVLGETGAGKERTARAIHTLSRRKGPLVTLNCGALPSNLVESELFGHQRGAFSGSDAARTGLFRAAEHGTLFLDELGELPLPAQAALLRVLDSGEVRPVGSDKALTVDVRVVGATNRDLDALAATGAFRPDLLHRMSGVRVRVPGLRAHREDIVGICRDLLDSTGVSLSASSVEELLRRDWPGNVRELRLTVLAAVQRATRDARSILVAADLGDAPASEPPRAGAQAEPDADLVLRARIETALQIHGGNVTHAAKDLGMGRSTIYEHITRMRIDPTSFRSRRG